MSKAQNLAGSLVLAGGSTLEVGVAVVFGYGWAMITAGAVMLVVGGVLAAGAGHPGQAGPRRGPRPTL